jgi:hypothetical protein
MGYTIYKKGILQTEGTINVKFLRQSTSDMYKEQQGIWGNQREVSKR